MENTADTAAVVSNELEAIEAITDTTPIPNAGRRGAGIWGVLLALVILFGYLAGSRRDALGRFAAQVADIVRDFRGYDPQF